MADADYQGPSKDELQELLAEANVQMAEMEELLRQLTAPPLSAAWVYEITDSYVAVFVEGKTQLCEKPHGLDVEMGDFVALAQTGQILEKIETHAPFGEIAVVRNLKEDSNEVEVELGGNIKLARVNPNKTPDLAKSDRVILDPAGSMIVMNLGKEHNRFALAAGSQITWNDIGGHDQAKIEMIEAIELPLRHPEIYQHYNKRNNKGFLLSGPPGCGKTLLGKAAATAIQDLVVEKTEEGKEVSPDAFMYVKGPEILDKYVGVAEQAIRGIFDKARQFKEENGFPCVVFVDEADAILGKRGSGVSSDMEKTIVPMFLSEMDGMDENGALIILATNRPDTLDPAIIREGRIDTKISIDRPDFNGACQIFEVHLRRTPVVDISREELAQRAATYLFSDDAAYFQINKKDDTHLTFGLAQMVSGAMIEGLVQQATTVALRRDLANKQNPTGIGMEDMITAVQNVLDQNRPQAKELAKEYVADFKDEVKNIMKVS